MFGRVYGKRDEAPPVEVLLHAYEEDVAKVRNVLDPLEGGVVLAINDAGPQTYHLGKVSDRVAALFVTARHSSGPSSTFWAVTEAIRAWNPRILVSVGTAAGSYRGVLVANRVSETRAGPFIEKITDYPVCVGPVLAAPAENGVHAVDPAALGVVDACTFAAVDWCVMRTDKNNLADQADACALVAILLSRHK